MNKEQQLKMCKDYYNKLCRTIKKDDAINRKLSPTGFLERTAEDMEDVTTFVLFRKWTLLRALLGAVVTIPALLLIGPAIPFYLSAGLAVLIPFMTGNLPGLIGYKMEKSKGKFGKIINKLCLSYTLRRYKKNLEKRFGSLLNAKNANQIDQEELNLFVEATHALATEYDNYAYNVGFNIIEAEEQKNMNKIKNILRKNGLTEKSKAQIQKIVDDNNKTVETWQDFYWAEKPRCKNLFQSVVDFDPENSENLECVYKAKRELEDGLYAPGSVFEEEVQDAINKYSIREYGNPVDKNFLSDANSKENNINKTNFTNNKNKTYDDTHDKNM